MDCKTVYLPVFGECECVVDCGKVISVYWLSEGNYLVTDSDNGSAANAICALAEKAIEGEVIAVTDFILHACRSGVIDEHTIENTANRWVHEQECGSFACGGMNGN
ncbi:MAG: hypothetical protein ACRDDY_13240 [Clostridium sp.]|uniref:hypothetical protein n=1 Tax=Clostridium sp. TaxID=1506 RepID=UPI003EE62B45